MPEQPGHESTLQSLREGNQRLRRAVEELSMLNDLARAIRATINSQEIMQTVVRRSLWAVEAEQGVVTLVEEDIGDPKGPESARPGWSVVSGECCRLRHHSADHPENFAEFR